MTTAILQQPFAKALKAVSKAVAGRSTLPILSHVLLQTDGDGELLVAANNLEMSIVTRVPAKGDRQWDITVPYRLLSDLVSQFPPERIDLEPVEADISLALNCVGFEANIKGLEAKEFVQPITEAPEGWIAVPLPNDFHAHVDRVAFAAATDEGRPVFTGVAIILNRLSLRMVAANGFRLSLDRMAWDCPEAVADEIEERGRMWGEDSVEYPRGTPHLLYIVPARALNEVATISKGSEEPLTMYVSPDAKKVVFVCGATVLASALIEGDFPDYNRVVPDKHETSMLVDRKELLDAVLVSNLFASDSANIVKFNVDGPNKVILLANSPERGDNEAKLTAKVEGEDLQIALNTIYVADALSSVSDCDTVTFYFGGSSAPVRMEAVGLDGWQHIIMPMHI